ncbi:increased DNA methylation 1-like [Quercus lobata]|uniref:increased DNA methylation 1-like n=1 Tax=Quercus lobata TaxID=97700 RepID=UPI0012446B6D|nr:increased DNA methylation 1-like [Quercus lobata]
MAYSLRNRKNKKIYVCSSGSSDSDSGYSDPDYTRIRPRRQAQQNNINKCNKKLSTDVRMVELGAACSSVRPRRGRPTKKRADEEGKKSFEVGESSRRRRRAPYSLMKRSRCANKSGPTESKRTILSWLIDLKMIEEKEEVGYMDDPCEQNILLKGMITRAGILCNCCNTEVTVRGFEAHAHSNLKRPYANIFLLRRNVSLLRCQLHVLDGIRKSRHCGFNLIEPRETDVDKYDDACVICADGGDLICCDNCPSTIHIDCTNLKRIPQDDWRCPYCVCKYCGDGGYANDELFQCFQCQKKFEVDINRPLTPDRSPNMKSFCQLSCKEILEHLDRELRVKNELGGGLSWTLIRQTDIHLATKPTNIDHFQQIVECNCKIAVVWDMMNESFDPIIDRHTNTNVIHGVVYNRESNLTRINFQRFYTAILEKNDEIISAASLRIHGTKIAEMPFVATNEKYRNQGMWQKLLLAIESVLNFLKVEKLIVPSIEDLVPMWTQKYGFSEVEDSVMNELKCFNALMFTRAVRLQKSMHKPAVKSEAMEVDGVGNNGNQNGEDAKQNQTNHMEQNAMEVDEVKNNDNMALQDGTNMSQNQTKLLLPDLNDEPPEEEPLVPME